MARPKAGAHRPDCAGDRRLPVADPRSHDNATNQERHDGFRCAAVNEVPWSQHPNTRPADSIFQTPVREVRKRKRETEILILFRLPRLSTPGCAMQRENGDAGVVHEDN